MSTVKNMQQRVGLLAGLILGLPLKYGMLFYPGVFDMDAYYEWGNAALAPGLVQSYHGIYFPLQYQLFAACAWTVARSGLEFFIVFKAANVVFDLGLFFLLVFILRRQGSNPIYALLYWLHPWFLTIFSLGYIDFQFSFFVLLSVWCLRGETVRDYGLAGLALGCAFVMKPQAQILLIATFCFVLSRYLRTRDMRPWAMLAGSVAFFGGYELFFYLTERSYASAWILPSSYLNISNVMPALTAQMTNIWYPVAYLMKPAGEPIYSVSDQIHILPLLSVKFLAAAVVLLLIGWHVFRIERATALSISEKFIRIFGFAAMLVPFVMTSGHENHLFLGTIFLVLLMGQGTNLRLKLAGHILLVVQFLHIYSLYGQHPGRLTVFLRQQQSDELAIVYSLVSLACFAVICRPLWRVSVQD